jgi:hypothetical protein
MFEKITLSKEDRKLLIEDKWFLLKIEVLCDMI